MLLPSKHLNTEVSTMDITTFIIRVYCVVDDFMKEVRLRHRGPEPTVSDSEVITMGIDTGNGLSR
jgi:hypothetical protein